MSTLKTKAQSILDEKDSKIIPENIKKDVTIFDVTGTVEEGVDTSDATATSDDIIEGKTAYIDGQKVRGTLQIAGSGPIYVDVVNVGDNNPDIDVTMFLRTNDKEVLDDSTQIESEISYSDLATAIDLTSDKIASGESVLGIEGTYEGLDTSDATATASDILSGKTAYVNGDIITGTLEVSDNSIIELANNKHIIFNCENLANILDDKLTVEQKAMQIYTLGSWQLPTMIIGYAYNSESQEAEPVGLTFGYSTNSLTLIAGYNVLANIDENNSGTEQYYKSTMTVQDLIDLLTAIGDNVNLKLNAPTATLYMYSPASFIISGVTNYEYGGTIIHIMNITNNFIKNAPTSLTETIGVNDRVEFDLRALATVIDDNTTAEEKDKYVNPVSSAASPIVVLTTGTFTSGSEGVQSGYMLCLHHQYQSGIYLTCISSDLRNVFTVSYNPVISDSYSGMDLYDTMKVSDLIDIFNDVGSSAAVTCTWDSDITFDFDTPISEITIKGPNLNKTIAVPAGTTFMEVINA